MDNSDFIGTLISLINKKTELHNEKLAFPVAIRKELPYVKAGLNLSEKQVLYILKRYQIGTISETARRAGLTQQYISTLIKGLFEQELIEKFSIEQKKKCVYLRLSQKGTALINENNAVNFDYMKRRVSEVLCYDEQTSFLSSLRFIDILMAKVNGDDLYLHDSKEYAAGSDVFYEKLHTELSESIGILNRYETPQNKENPSKQMKVNFTESNCMSSVFEYGQLSISNLARINIIPLDTTSKIVTKLVKSGILERFQKPNDRRTYYVRLTQAGHDSMTASRALFTAHLQKLFVDISYNDRQKLIDSLIYVNEILNRL